MSDSLADKIKRARDSAHLAMGGHRINVSCKPEDVLAICSAAEQGAADTARLNWLIACSSNDDPNHWITLHGADYSAQGPWDRAAIDAARATDPDRSPTYDGDDDYTGPRGGEAAAELAHRLNEARKLK